MLRITAKNYKEAVEKIKHLFNEKDTEKHEAIMETLYEYKNYGEGDEDIDRPINKMLYLFNLKFKSELEKHNDIIIGKNGAEIEVADFKSTKPKPKFKVGDNVIYSRTHMEVVETNYGGDIKKYLLKPLVGYPINAIAYENQIEFLYSSSETSNSEKQPKPKAEKQPKPKAEKQPKPKAEKQPKPKAEKNPKEKALPKWVQKQEATANVVNSLPDEIIAFKKYLALNNKRVERRRIELRVIDMNRMAITQTVRKTSQYAKLFEAVLDDLVKTANQIGNRTDTFIIPEKILSQVKEAINDYDELSSVTIIKSFLKTVYGGLSTPKRISTAKNLINKIDIYLKSDISKEDRLKSYVKQVHGHITDWLKTEKWHITQAELNGFAGFAGIGMEGIGFIANEAISTDKVMSSVDFVKRTFVPMGFTGRFRKLIGDPSSPFRIMFYGLGGHGKSTLAIEFSHYLASEHNSKTLYVAGEEGLTSTFQDKVSRMKAIHKNLFFVQKMPSDLSPYDVVFFDSVDTLELEPSDLRDIQKKYKKLSIVTIHQVTKEGKFKGSNGFDHDTDAAFNVVNGEAFATKNRFGGKEPIKVIFKK